jgi:predicted AAA+ superfamily ATPase
MEYKRKYYLDHMLALCNTKFIKTMIGLRRIGKSTLLQQFIETVWASRCLYINLEELQYHHLLDHHVFHDYIVSHITGKEFVLIDEVQMIRQRSVAINSLFSTYQGKVDFYITWSNSELLSSEISTYLRWRTYDITVYPMRYTEYCNYHDYQINSQTRYQYIKDGWLISTYQLPNQNLQYDYTKSIINTVFIKDIVARHKIKDINLLQELLLYIISNIGNKTNLSNILSYMNAKWYKTNYTTLWSYVHYLISVQLVYEAQTRDIKGKKIFDRERKYYICDHLLRYVYLWDTNQWYGKLYENIVYMTLLYHGYQVWIGKQWNLEVDFVAQKNDKQMYIQVAYMLTDQQVVDREFTSLSKVTDHRSKYVISWDQLLLKAIEGIQHRHIRDIDTLFA